VAYDVQREVTMANGNPSEEYKDLSNNMRHYRWLGNRFVHGVPASQ
jgi:hypothetical protein